MGVPGAVKALMVLAHIDAMEAELEECRQERNLEAAARSRLAGQVAALREALRHAQCPWLVAHAACPIRTTLADTEAAGRAHDQRMRLEGARALTEYLRSLSWAYYNSRAVTLDQAESWLADMEREATGEI